MKKILIFILSYTLFLNCYQNEKPQRKKINSQLGTYLYVRLFNPNAFGDPLCGGDAIGTALGLNKDTPKPIRLEVGKSYEFEGNTNYKFTINFFSIKFNNPIKITITLQNSCQGLSTFYYKCDLDFGLKQLINNSNFSCTSSEDLINGDMVLNGSFQSCIIKNISQYIILNSRYYSNCKYKVEIQESQI